MEYLRWRFGRVHEAAQQAALRADSADPDGVWAHLSSKVFSALLLRERALPTGSDDHGRLSRAEVFVERGDLAQAVRELEGLSAPAARAVKGWMRQARDRLVLEQSIRMLQAEALLLMESFQETAADQIAPNL